MKSVSFGSGEIFNANVLDVYDRWNSPICIVSDGPYGVSGFDGDPSNHKSLADIYRPHIQKWSEKSTSQTTLWFWCTEVGWATVHSVLEENGWIYRACNVWDKGIKHIAGNCNGKTMRKFPVVTEVCVHYVRAEHFYLPDGKEADLQHWLHAEWKRTGLPFRLSNDACGVKNAASRKYFTLDHAWYFPPAEHFEKIRDYANEHGRPEGRPYFSLDGQFSITKNQWESLRAKFNFEYGVTNVWSHPALRNSERLREGSAMMHPNQKPLALMDRIIQASTDAGDLVWEPFGGTFSASVSAMNSGRKFVACEMNKEFYEIGRDRIKKMEEDSFFS